jgi:hypothetical protein
LRSRDRARPGDQTPSDQPCAARQHCHWHTNHHCYSYCYARRPNDDSYIDSHAWRSDSYQHTNSYARHSGSYCHAHAFGFRHRRVWQRGYGQPYIDLHSVHIAYVSA